MMELMPEELKELLRKYPENAQDELGFDAKILVKYFGGSAATWLITGATEMSNGDWILYGFMTLGIPDFDGDLIWEWGTVFLKELEEVRFPPFGLPVERDLHLKEDAKVRDEVFMCKWVK